MERYLISKVIKNTYKLKDELLKEHLLTKIFEAIIEYSDFVDNVYMNYEIVLPLDNDYKDFWLDAWLLEY